MSVWLEIEWKKYSLSVCLHRDMEDLPMWEPNLEAVPQTSYSLSSLLAFISAVSFLWNVLPFLAFKILYKVQCNATSPVKSSILYNIS